MRELIIHKTCDSCGEEATATFVVGIVAAETRPSLHLIDACPTHAETFAAFAETVQNTAPWHQSSTPASARRRNGDGPDRHNDVACEICGKTVQFNSLVQHIWAKHIPGGIRPAPKVCPECGKEFERAQSASVHRTLSHGFDVRAEAYALARSSEKDGRKA